MLEATRSFGVAPGCAIEVLSFFLVNILTPALALGQPAATKCAQASLVGLTEICWAPEEEIKRVLGEERGPSQHQYHCRATLTDTPPVAISDDGGGGRSLGCFRSL